MVIENQRIKIKWNNSNKKHFISKGYEYTHTNDEFYVGIDDLSFNSTIKYDVKCDYCGYIYKSSNSFRKNANKIVNKDACSKCNGKKGSDVLRIKSWGKVYPKLKERCNDLNYKLLTNFDTFKGVKGNVEFVCPKHGKQSLNMHFFVHEESICIKCSYEKRGIDKRISKNELIKRIESKNNNKLINPDDYNGVYDSNLKIKCGCCNKNIFITSLSLYQREISPKTRCDECAKNESYREMLIRQYLDSNNILYEQQKRFKGCRDNKPLPFDFYLPDYNICIEYDGKQHFDPNFFKLLVKDNWEYKFNKLQEHDKIKDKYCLDNNITIIRLNDNNFNDMEKIIKKEIKKLGIRYSLIS